MAKTLIEPLHDFVLVKRTAREEKTSGGLHVPAGVGTRNEGIIIAAGPGLLNDDGERRAMGVKPGDRIVWGKYDGIKIEVDGEPRLMFREADIYATLETI